MFIEIKRTLCHIFCLIQYLCKLSYINDEILKTDFPVQAHKEIFNDSLFYSGLPYGELLFCFATLIIQLFIVHKLFRLMNFHPILNHYLN
jgi:hypothetical protein